MCPEQLTVAVTAMASAIARCRSDEEIALLAAVFTQLGDTLATIAAQRALCGAKDGG